MEKPPFGQTFLGAVLAGVVVGLLMLYLARILSPGSNISQASAPQTSTDSSAPTPPSSVPAATQRKVRSRPSPSSTTSPQDDSPPPNAPAATQDIAPPTPVQVPRIPKGRFEYNRQVAVLGSGFYGWKLPLTLEAVENDPSNRLAFHFVVENKDSEKYTLLLSHPHDTVSAVDDAHAEHSFISAEDIDDLSGMVIPAFSRRRFIVFLQPLTTARNSLQTQLVFELRYDGSSSGSSQKVEIPDIPIDHLNQ